MVAMGADEPKLRPAKHQEGRDWKRDYDSALIAYERAKLEAYGEKAKVEMLFQKVQDMEKLEPFSEIKKRDGLISDLEGDKRRLQQENDALARTVGELERKLREKEAA